MRACTQLRAGRARAEWWLVVVLVASVAVSGLGQENSVLSRAREADRVVVGRVTQVAPIVIRNEYGDQLVVSRTTIVVEEVLQGRPTPTLTVDIEGGRIGDLALEVSDMPKVKPGDRGIFFLTRSVDDSHILHRRGAGMLALNDEEVVDRPGLTVEMIRRHLAGPTPSSPR